MMPTVLNGVGEERTGEWGWRGGRCQREGSGARVAKTILGILQAAVQI